MKSLVDISHLSTMQTGNTARSLIILTNTNDVANFAHKTKGSGIVVGGGSNIVFPDNHLDRDIARMKIAGIKIVSQNDAEIVVNVGAGENWDRFVEWAVERNFSGLEALSSIPGTVGAAPIQNIGAYGSEAKDSITEIKAYDTKQDTFVTVSNKDAAFAYRDSVFKQNPGRWIITNVVFRLNKKLHRIPDYKDVKVYFESRKILSPTLKQIREAITQIRSNKLPDPKIVPNCGSFFKNPFISKELVEKIKKENPSVPVFEQGDQYKIPAGFLIDSLGFKGKSFGGIEVYKNNALVLTNPRNGSFADLLSLKSEIQNAVLQKFGIALEPEVNLIIS